MQRLTPVNFECDQCHYPHHKVLPPNTNFTTCHRCGSLINVSHYQTMSYRQRQQNQIRNFPSINNNPFEMGEAFPEEEIIERLNFPNPNINYLYEEEEENQLNNNNNRNNGMFNINIPNPRYNRNAARRHRMYMMGVEDPEREIERLAMQISLLRGNSVQKPKIKLKKEKMIKKYFVKNDKDEFEEPNCCICLCLMKIGENVTRLKCGHIFHFKCLDKWVQNKDACPFCRGKINEKRSKTTKKK